MANAPARLIADMREWLRSAYRPAASEAFGIQEPEISVPAEGRASSAPGFGYHEGLITERTPMDLQSLIIFLIVGLIAGWLAGQLVRGSGFGLVGDLIVGIVGAFIGLGIYIGGGIIGAIINAFIGAVILLLVLRVLRRA
jgi:uncharacterized membrane protein YeaQ/YmgE (transglycosylase-associated protein family)